MLIPRTPVTVYKTEEGYWLVGMPGLRADERWKFRSKDQAYAHAMKVAQARCPSEVLFVNARGQKIGRSVKFE
jgi:hypothetical protein